MCELRKQEPEVRRLLQLSTCERIQGLDLVATGMERKDVLRETSIEFGD